MPDTTITWSPQQEAFFNWVETGSGNLILEAVAGSGKSTSLVEGTRRMNGSVAIVVYNKGAGNELKEKTRGLNHVKASTVHGIGYGALRYRFPREAQNRNWVEPRKVAAILERFRAGVLPAEEQRFDDHVPFVLKTVSMAKQRGLGFLTPVERAEAWYQMVEHFGLEDDLPENGAGDLEFGLAVAKRALLASNADVAAIDFDDMVYLPLVLNLRLFQNDWVLVDEAQDTNPARRALVKKMLRPGGRLVAVGDRHQAIYGFTGADNDALDVIRREFAAADLPLTVTYRCPRAVVAKAREYVSHIEAAPGAPEGVYRQQKLILDQPEEPSEAQSNSDFKAYDALIEDLAEGDAILPEYFEPTDTVLCRLNAPLVRLAFALIRRGVPCKIEGRDVGQGLVKLVNRWRVVKLDALHGRLEKYLDRETRKALAKGQEDRAARVEDQVETLYVLIDRARERGLTEKAELVEMVQGMFADDVAKTGLLTLCSTHKAKGREWLRVFVLDRARHMPSPWARQDWQKDQELNLIYVALTRALEELVDLTWQEKTDD